MGTFVLVPAAWCGGWVWEFVAAELREAGHCVITPTLDGLGDRAGSTALQVGLSVHVEDLVSAIERENLHDISLVGWSYGGIPMTGAAHRVPERVRQLIYLDSAVPTDGQAALDSWEDDGSIRAMYEARIVSAGTPGSLPFDVDELGGQISDPERRAWFLAQLSPHPYATLTEPVQAANPAAARIPRAFVLCPEGVPTDEPDPEFLVRLRSDPTWRYVEIAANHFAPVNNPELVAETLLALV